MKTLIVACGDTGVTMKVANMLAEMIDGEVEVSDGKIKELGGYDTVILGTNIHFGKFNKKFLKIVKKKIDVPRLFVYISGAEIERKDVYIQKMRSLVPAAEEIVYVWGELNSKNASFFKRFAIESFITGRKNDGLPSPRILDKELRNLVRLLGK